MLYEEIEIFAQKEETLPKILELIKEDIEIVEYNTDMILKHNLVTNGEDASSAMAKLNGAYNRLNVAHDIVDTEKKNKESKKFGSIKIEAGVEGKKVTDTEAKNKASESVQSYRRTRNIIGAYRKNAENSISNLQSILKYLGIKYHKPAE